jgi:Ser/Thr protein kinase RdoA (MazF antagonist)
MTADPCTGPAPADSQTEPADSTGPAVAVTDPAARTPDGDPARRRRLEAIARSALPGHGLSRQARLTLLNISENATYAVDDDVSGRSVLRVHRPGYHSLAAIESELAWIGALRAGGVVATPAVLAAPDGARVVPGRHPDGEVRHTVRFAWADGVEPRGDRLVDDFRELGAVAARLHAHTRCWALPAGFTRFRWDAGTSIGAAGHWGRWQDGMGVAPAEREVLGRLAGLLARRLAAFGDGPDRFGLVHADMRLANLLVDPAGSAPVTVIDFDDCGFGWYLYDLGASLSFIEHDPQVPELIDAWAGGYRRVAPLTAAEVAELPTFVLLRRLLLVAWIGSHADTDLAREMGAGFTAASCQLAEAYLTRPPS